MFRQNINEADKPADTPPVNSPDGVDEPEKQTIETIKVSEKKKAQEDKKE